MDCSSDAIFGVNSCWQCFEWGDKTAWDYIWLLVDSWINPTESSQIVYKEEQDIPEMLNLAPDNVIWGQTPSAEGFWEYTDEFDALYSESDWWYILEAGKSVTWIQSKMWYAYELKTNTAEEGTNIGLLVYPIAYHTILEDGTPSIDDDEHLECVLFKSSNPTEEVKEKEVEKLPETGPTEYILLLIIAMILGVWLLRLSKRA